MTKATKEKVEDLSYKINDIQGALMKIRDAEKTKIDNMTPTMISAMEKFDDSVNATHCLNDTIDLLDKVYRNLSYVSSEN